MDQRQDAGSFQGEIGALLLDMGRLAAAAGMAGLRLIFLPAPEDFYCPGPGLGIPCHKPFDHRREDGRCACCHLIEQDSKLQYLVLTLY